jgi:hypothetical protein
MLVVGQPQLGDEAGKANEEWGVEQALVPEQVVATPAHKAESKAHDKNGWVGRRRPVDHRLSVHARCRTVGVSTAREN